MSYASFSSSILAAASDATGDLKELQHSIDIFATHPHAQTTPGPGDAVLRFTLPKTTTSHLVSESSNHWCSGSENKQPDRSDSTDKATRGGTRLYALAPSAPDTEMDKDSMASSKKKQRGEASTVKAPNYCLGCKFVQAHQYVDTAVATQDAINKLAAASPEGKPTKYNIKKDTKLSLERIPKFVKMFGAAGRGMRQLLECTDCIGEKSETVMSVTTRLVALCGTASEKHQQINTPEQTERYREISNLFQTHGHDICSKLQRTKNDKCQGRVIFQNLEHKEPLHTHTDSELSRTWILQSAHWTMTGKQEVTMPNKRKARGKPATRPAQKRMRLDSRSEGAGGACTTEYTGCEKDIHMKNRAQASEWIQSQRAAHADPARNWRTTNTTGAACQAGSNSQQSSRSPPGMHQRLYTAQEHTGDQQAVQQVALSPRSSQQYSSPAPQQWQQTRSRQTTQPMWQEPTRAGDEVLHNYPVMCTQLDKSQARDDQQSVVAQPHQMCSYNHCESEAAAGLYSMYTTVQRLAPQHAPQHQTPTIHQQQQQQAWLATTSHQQTHRHHTSEHATGSGSSPAPPHSKASRAFELRQHYTPPSQMTPERPLPTLDEIAKQAQVALAFPGVLFFEDSKLQILLDSCTGVTTTANDVHNVLKRYYDADAWPRHGSLLKATLLEAMHRTGTDVSSFAAAPLETEYFHSIHCDAFVAASSADAVVMEKEFGYNGVPDEHEIKLCALDCISKGVYISPDMLRVRASKSGHL